MMFLPDIINIFPGAKIIWIHRDPFDAISSYCPMIEGAWNLFFGNTKKQEVGSFIRELYIRMLKKTMEHRKTMNCDIIDISFDQLINDKQSVLQLLSSKLEIPIIENREEGNSSDFFKNKYSFDPSNYNISKEKIEESFSFYSEQYSKYL